MPSRDSRRLSELTIGDAKRILVYGSATLVALALFLLLLANVLVALLLGVVCAAYLLPVQEFFERRLRARAGSALVTMALIVVPLVGVVSYTWYELAGYSAQVTGRREQIIGAVSRTLVRYLPVGYEQTRGGLEAAFAEAVTRSAEAVEEVREGAALLLASAAIFIFTVYYVLTQRVKLAGYIKVRVPGEYEELYERLTKNIGSALHGALLAVLIDQSLKAVVITTLNLVFGVPLAVVLGVVTFFIGFFPLLGEWAAYVPVSIYLLVFLDRPAAAAIYFGIGVTLTLGSSLLLRPRLASSGARRFSFYWMLVALVAGVYAFGVPGIVLGPAILGLAKAVADTLVGGVRYETSLLASEHRAGQAEAAKELDVPEAKDASPAGAAD